MRVEKSSLLELSCIPSAQLSLQLVEGGHQLGVGQLLGLQSLPEPRGKV